MISTRYASALCLAFALTLAPVVIYTYLDLVVADGRSTERISQNAVGWILSNRPATWGKRSFDSDDWFEQRFAIGSDAFVLTVIRSYDFKRLYHHPELDVAYGASLSSDGVVYFPSHPNVPVHVLRSRSGRGMVFYVLHYDTGFVADPVAFQLRSSVSLLLHGRRQMTLFFVHDLNAPTNDDVAPLASLQTLFGVVEQFAGSETRAWR